METLGLEARDIAVQRGELLAEGDLDEAERARLARGPLAVHEQLPRRRVACADNKAGMTSRRAPSG